MSATPRLGLPFLSAGQAQKEITHNEALQTLDMVVAGTVEEGPRNDAPASQLVGTAYIVGNSPTGAWAGKAQSIAGFTSGGWRFVVPAEGLSVYVKANATWANYRLADWEMGILRGSRLVVDGLQVGSTASSTHNAAQDVTHFLAKAVQLRLFGNSTRQSQTCAATSALIMCSRGSNLEHT
jgi:hypothetical protein